MIKESLAQLQKVDLREVWKSEPGDFRPWLADPGGLKLLGDTIGVDLELEAQEKDVGSFRADILCKNIADNTWVLIENQLETTDHTHLGQFLTYAAGLDAVIIIWIAKRFTDEHRATLDWLNEVTGKNINIFGLGVELRNMSITLRHFLSRISVVSVHESSWLGRLIQTAAGRDGGTGCPLGNRSGDRAKAACRA